MKRFLVIGNLAVFLLASPLAALAQTPFNGTPVALPATFEAENFDLGGQNVAYHDNALGNAGGQYRASEDVDIVLDPAAGYVVNNFETGEWMIYTVSVPSTGNYDIAISASNNYAASSAFHVEIDNLDVTGNVPVPMTGSWSTFQWVTAPTVTLSAGTHQLKLYSNTQYFNVDKLRVTAGASQPWGGTPVQVPATFEAENFDTGGQDVGYHDNVAGNAGGQYRTSEDVDIILGPTGGYVVNNFETGEWMAYTISVPTAGSYAIAVNASNNFSSSSAFHISIDDTPVTGSINVPITGSWSTFQWVTAPAVTLGAGTHRLKLHSDVQYFNVDQLRVSTATPAAGGPLFWSKYESGVALGAPTECYNNGCWQDVTGTDSATGFTWPAPFGQSRFQMLTDSGRFGVFPDATTISNWMSNQLVTVTGHNGNATQALFQQINMNGAGTTAPQGDGATQDPLMLLPTTSPTDFYASYWVKFQPDMNSKLVAAGAGGYRTLFEFKTTEASGPDRILDVSVVAYSGTPRWRVSLNSKSTVTGQWDTLYQSADTGVPVATDRWVKLEVFFHRDAAAGRIWAAVDGQNITPDWAAAGPIATIGANNGAIDRIMLHQLYSGTDYPISQWVDDVQIWDHFPAPSGSEPWYDPPYGPH